MRGFKILASQLKCLSMKEAALLIINALFKWQEILIYNRELNGQIKYCKIQHDLSGFIKKGELFELDNLRKTTKTLPWEFSCDLYDSVKDFFIFKKNGEIGHISWIYYKGVPNRLIKLSENEAEIKYSLTLEPYRGMGLYPMTLVESQKYLKGKGFKRVFICVDKDNIPSIRGIEKAGFNIIGKIKLIKLLGFQLNKRFSIE